MSGLTKLQIKQLRHADTICVDFSTLRNLSQVRAIKKAKNSPSGFEQTEYIDIRVEVDIYQGYRHFDPVREKQTVKCFGYLSSIPYFEEVQTFLACLKEGDELIACFVATEPDTSNPQSYQGHMTTHLRGYEGELLNHDRFYFRIKRGEKHLKFFLEDSICPNNTARMIQHY